MTLYLPESLRWLAWIAGASWPDGDEDAMWDISADWKSAAKVLTDLIEQVLQAKQAIEQAYTAGAGAEAMGQQFDELISGDQSLKELADLLNAVSDSTFDMGTQLQSTKITVVVSLCWLALEIIWAWVFPPTAPAATISTTRSFLKVFEDFIQNAIERLAGKLGASAQFGFRGRPAAVRWCGHQTVNSGSTVTNGAPTTICVLAEPLSPRQMRSHCNPSAANPNVSDRRTWRDR